LDSIQRLLLRPLATREATSFLRSRLESVDMRLSERRAYLATVGLNEATQPGEDGEATWVAQRERRLLYELLAACQEELFVDVLRRRLEAVQRRAANLATSSQGGVSGIETDRSRFEAWTEQQILEDLARQWLLWIKQRMSRSLPATEPCTSDLTTRRPTR
ncbi:MAG: hypothetical protein IT193_17995, partial [Propionibacteriaceae bacterium]|nr:hypothetical protein [Propionibacteriaceae bacterium]